MEMRIGGNGHADPRVRHGTESRRSSVLRARRDAVAAGFGGSSSVVRSSSAPLFGAPVRLWRCGLGDSRGGREPRVTGAMSGVLDAGVPGL